LNGVINSGDDFSIGPVKATKFYVKALSGNTTVAGTLDVGSTLSSVGNVIIGPVDNSVITMNSITGDVWIGGKLNANKDFTVGLPLLPKFKVIAATGDTNISGKTNSVNDFTVGTVGIPKFFVEAATGNTIINGNITTTPSKFIQTENISALVNTLNITGSTINIGSPNGNVNIIGSLTYIEATNLEVVDRKNIVINKNNLANSAYDAGILIEEGGIIKGYIKVSNDRNEFLIKAPNNSDRMMMSQTLTRDYSANLVTLNSLTLNNDASFNGLVTVLNSMYIRDNLNMLGNLNINTNKFNVDSTTGNTSIAGTLTVGNNINGNLNGNININNSSSNVNYNIPFMSTYTG
jgi:hypothetical protein